MTTGGGRGMIPSVRPWVEDNLWLADRIKGRRRSVPIEWTVLIAEQAERWPVHASIAAGVKTMSVIPPWCASLFLPERTCDMRVQ